MSAVDDIMRQIPMDQLAQQLGVDQGTAEKAVAAAVPQLIGSMQNNAQDPQQERALAGALQQHGENGVSLDGGVNLNSVDTADGAKIVDHVFGDPDQAARAVSQQSGVADSLVQKLLPILAPIVLAYLAQQISRQGGLGDVLGNILGGGHQQQSGQSQQRSGGGLGDILGQILGGHQGQAQQPAQPQQPVQPAQVPTQPQGGNGGGLEMPMDATDNGQTQTPPAGKDEGEGGLGGLLGSIFGGKK